MKRISSVILGVGMAAILSACSTTPEKPIAELETARAVVPQVEASPRAGVAAENISVARKSLDTANKLVTSGGNVDDIRFQATVATMNAQIANERILTANAKDELAAGEVERQKVVLAARERERASLEQELKDLQMKKTDRGLVLTLGDVLFDTGKATLKPGAYATVDRLANALKEDSSRKVLIEGHTDSTGSPEFNQMLSQNRAQSVQAALMERGVPGNQTSVVGKGQGSPIASNSTAAGRQQNRRVEMIFTEDRTRVATDEN
jgi:outer membrane protein OmpA-like peptidoglycan-associated protein